MSLRKIAVELDKLGYRNERGAPCSRRRRSRRCSHDFDPDGALQFEMSGRRGGLILKTAQM
jgi:hypothetical protein